MARIQIERRAGGYTDRARKYKVLIDGSRRGTIAAGEVIGVDVDAGQHTVTLRLDWVCSRTLTFEVSDDATVKLWCEPAANPLTGLWYSTFGRRRYIRLRPA